MSIVDFDTATWNDPWFQKLSLTGKLLFVYLWTNDHKSLSGIYVISKKTISNETGMNEKQINEALKELLPKVLYDVENFIVFVANYVKRQFLRTGKISSKIIQAISNSLMLLPEGHPFIGEFLNKYKSLEIKYGYPIDTLSGGYTYPPGEGKGEGKGKGIEGGCGGKILSDFETFWNAYPKKKSKGDAEKAWLKIRPSEHLIGVILSAVSRAKTSADWLKDGGQYIPHPATWLNRKGWEDDFSAPEGTAAAKDELAELARRSERRMANV